MQNIANIYNDWYMTSENALKAQEEKHFLKTFFERFYHKACAYLENKQSWI